MSERIIAENQPLGELWIRAGRIPDGAEKHPHTYAHQKTPWL
jgi:hypothetical protein